jgi:predicted transposase YbfD/YdcC
LPEQSRMPAPADAATAVISEAEGIVRRAEQREQRRLRRAARAGRARRRREADRECRAARKRGLALSAAERARDAAEQARLALLERVAELRAAAGGSVLDCFAGVPDPRDRRGRRHSLPCVLGLVVTAMLHGKTLLADIAAWTAHAPQDVLAALGARTGPDGRRSAPCARTVARLLGLVGARALSRAVTSFLAAAEQAAPVAFPLAGPVALPHLACDGKEVKGARRPDGTSLFLLSAATAGTGRAVVLADREIPAKTNEIPEIGPMLAELNDRFPLAGWVLTADALHAQRGLASLACENLLAHYVLTVKGNQFGLLTALQALSWAGARRCAVTGKGHGRRERRACLVMDVPDEVKDLFPHARQVAKVVRTRTVTAWKSDGKRRRRATSTSTETVYLVTSLTAREAAPEHVAAYARAHWAIENQVHWVRDVTLREDSSKVRATQRPRNLATLRNLQTGLIRQHGRNDIAATIREAEYDITLVYALLRLKSAL